MLPQPRPEDEDGFFAYYIEAALALAERRTGVRLESRHLQPDALPHRASTARYYDRPDGTFSELARYSDQHVSDNHSQ